mgnify:CR=1 FL=1
MSDTEGLTKLGSNKTDYHYDDPSGAMLETFHNQHPTNDYAIPFECTEFTSLCPKTGQPDFATIQIVYVPNDLCIESKSLKLYLFAFRNHGAFHEDCVNQIANDIFEKIKPKYLRVFGNFTVRGGIAIKPVVIKAQADLPQVNHNHCEYLVETYDRLSH